MKRNINLIFTCLICQKTKETEEENRQKLVTLEVVVDRLEQGVLKLEAENVKLKQQQQEQQAAEVQAVSVALPLQSQA